MLAAHADGHSLQPACAAGGRGALICARRPGGECRVALVCLASRPRVRVTLAPRPPDWQTHAAGHGSKSERDGLARLAGHARRAAPAPGTAGMTGAADIDMASLALHVPPELNPILVASSGARVVPLLIDAHEPGEAAAPAPAPASACRPGSARRSAGGQQHPLGAGAAGWSGTTKRRSGGGAPAMV